MYDRHPIFEETSSALFQSNDGRLIIRRDHEHEQRPFLVIDTKTGQVELATFQQELADAYVAGYDEAQRLAQDDEPASSPSDESGHGLVRLPDALDPARSRSEGVSSFAKLTGEVRSNFVITSTPDDPSLNPEWVGSAFGVLDALNTYAKEQNRLPYDDTPTAWGFSSPSPGVVAWALSPRQGGGQLFVLMLDDDLEADDPEPGPQGGATTTTAPEFSWDPEGERLLVEVELAWEERTKGELWLVPETPDDTDVEDDLVEAVKALASYASDQFASVDVLPQRDGQNRDLDGVTVQEMARRIAGAIEVVLYGGAV